MNSKHYILAVSAIALLQPIGAFAESAKDPNAVRAEEASTGHITTDAKKAWKDVKHDASEASKQIKEGASDASKDIKAFFTGEDEKVPAKEMSFKRASSASGLIGAPVYNSKDTRVGTVKDIIINGDGKADFAVIADGEFPGFDGKLVAFPFSDITTKTADGDVIAPLSETVINAAAEFKYEADASDTKVKTVPAGDYSVAKLLDGDVVSDTKEKVGSVEDIYFKGGEASMVIVGFDKVMGMGGKNVVADFAPATVVNDGKDLDIQLSAKQSSSLASYKTAAKK